MDYCTHLRKISLLLLLSAMAGICCFSGLTGTDPPSGKPNIIILLVDDAGYADFGFMGSKDLETPYIDQLAEAGVVCTDAHVTASVCGPSRAGLITGRYQQRFGYECNPPLDFTGVDLNEQTLASALKSNGYITAAFGKWHLGDDPAYRPNQRGFDYFWGFLAGSRSYFPYPEDNAPGPARLIRENDRITRFEGYLTDVLGNRCVDFIDKNRDRPFFIYWSPNAVHTPMEATREDLERYKGHPRQQLAAMTWALDRAVGSIIRKLEKEKLLENTLIFFLSDNGGAHNNQSSNHPLKGFKGNKFEGGHRVPFFVHWPARIRDPGSYEKLVSSLDIFATSVIAAGMDPPSGDGLDGINLIPYLTARKTGFPHPELYWRKDKMAAAREGSYKLIRLDGYGYRLYELNEDPGETNDLQNRIPDVFSRVNKGLEAWEEDKMKPLWLESEAWNRVTGEIHKALMENREPRYTSPRQMDQYFQDNSARSHQKGQNNRQQYFNPGAIWYDNLGVPINAHGGGILNHQGTYYWFGEHKIEGRAGNKAQVGIGCYSSKNLYDWKNEGIAMEVSDDPDSKIIRGCIIERPKVIYNKKTGKFVMWFHHELKDQGYSSALTGVAVSDRMTGPYHYIDSYRPNAEVLPLNLSRAKLEQLPEPSELEKWSNAWKKAVRGGLFVKRDLGKGQMSRDMTLYVDKDEKAYHIHASEENQTLHISELNDTYTGFTDHYIRVQPGRHNEAPAMFKKDDKYYMITSGCTGWDPNAARLLVSGSMMGHWEYLGNPCVGENREITFDSQSTYILPVKQKEGVFIFMADRWNPENAIDGRYVWLPVHFDKEGIPFLQWHDQWSLDDF